MNQKKAIILYSSLVIALILATIFVFKTQEYAQQKKANDQAVQAANRYDQAVQDIKSKSYDAAASTVYPDISDYLSSSDKQNTASQTIKDEISMYNYAKAKIEMSKSSPDYNTALDYINDVHPVSNVISTDEIGNLKNEINQKIDEQKKAEAKKAEEEQKRKEESAPLKVVEAYVQKNSIGTPEAYVIVRNTSNKTIDAYKVSILCYNSFGEPVSDFSGSNEYRGIAQDVYISPGETFGYNYYWLLAVQDTTTKITATITEVHFTDGTTWPSANE